MANKEHGYTIRGLNTRLANGTISATDYANEVAKADTKLQNKLNKIANDYPDRLKQYYLDNREYDYSGLTGLTKQPIVRDAEAEATDMVNEFEGRFETDELWKTTDAANKAIEE